MIIRPIKIIRRFSHSHKPNPEIDYASWYKSEDYKVKINDMSNKIDNMSNKIDYIHDKAEGVGAIITGCMIGAGIGITIPIIVEVFKRFL